MTPDDRMKLAVLAAVYDASDFDTGMAALQSIFEFVEQMEFKAHIEGQDMQIELHKDHVGLHPDELCNWREDI